ncbi:glycosyltransferase [Sulfurimonas sp. SWIR-19]|uniref:glycosyltransferase n=1 Tax=Sulfurimonas sp. SWIR-19 TaxID=2878390 RepID=UPI001CF5B605|nr:glycosyltransferase [Sulfurimonas sp. SWIR-19]UCM99438.1 glycosyltransferase [Sulfurimonas sp. SWIR-19]
MALSGKRYGRKDALKTLIEPFMVFFFIASLLLYTISPYFYYIKNEVFIVLGAFALWRYGWLILNFLRALIYAKIAYPKLKKKIARLESKDRYPDHIYFSIPSYKEENWVSVETFRSIMNELADIPSSATVIVSTSGDPHEDSIIYQTCKSHPAFEKVELVFQHQKEGKRIAMGHSLRAIARRYHKKSSDYNSVTLFMDGDSYLEKGFLRKILPHFAIEKKLGALTTNEVAYIRTNSNLYKDWFNLKFGQRHILFQSHSLSKKVLTLTGRFSAYRTDIVIQDKFIKRLENDVITTVLSGKFRFLMGDDKTTWFNLLEAGWDMRYIPDALCYSLESRDANFFELSRSLPYRWYGNTLRNSDRALALGPKRIKSFFIWWAILDQRISMWTSLVGITGSIILGVTISYLYFFFYIVWILYVRIFHMSIIAYNGHPVSVRTIPLMLYSQWIGSLVKIKALFHISDQSWSKGKETQKNNASIAKVDHPLFDFMPKYLMTLSYALFLFLLLLTYKAIALPDFDVLKNEPPVHQKSLVYYAKDYGVVADDGIDDARALNRLIQKVPDESIIYLPEGALDLMSPVIIHRSNLSIEGVSEQKTHFYSHLQTKDIAAIRVEGKILNRIGFLTRDTKYADSVITAHFTNKKIPYWIKITQPNDTHFLNSLHSKVWNKKYPYLRQEITSINSVHNKIVFLNNALSTPFQANKAQIYALKMIENIKLKNFSISQIVPGKNIQSVSAVYKNMFPEYQVNLIDFMYVAHSYVENISLINAGRHPLSFENVFESTAQNLYINGAWNKGKKGNGYVKFSRTFSSRLQNATIKGVRHLTIQWSSANNIFSDLKMYVDINLHGGYTHNNSIKNIRFFIPKTHKWKGIVHTPDDARWAPPDGPNNLISDIQYFF